MTQTAPTSAAQPPIPWNRYWVGLEGLSKIELDGGFLKLPSSLRRRYTPNETDHLKTFADLAEIPCLVLLGSSGLGKSHELRRAVTDQPVNSIYRACYLDLRGRSSAGSIHTALHSDPVFQGWFNGQHALTLTLDSLDECQRRVSDVGQIICDELRSCITPTSAKLRLRLGCRSSEWSAELKPSLDALFPTPKDSPLSVQVFHLERLTREQSAEAARYRGAAAESFLTEIDHLGLGALAAHPITLDLLLADLVSGHPLGRTRIEIYERGLLSLCVDKHQTTAAAPRNTTTAEQRLALAARGAAIGALSDRYIFALDIDQVSQPNGSTVATADLLGELRITPSLPINLPVLRETLLCGLFESAPNSRVAWRHRSYGEFLAARHLSANLHVDDLVGLFCDTTTSIARLHPQLEEVAAWLAEFNSDFFDRVADANAEIFLRCDPHLLQPSVRERLASAYLRRVEQHDAAVPGWFNDLPIERLDHPNLSAQLRPLILDPTRPSLLRRAAVQIAAACRCRDLSLSCVPLLFATDTPDGLITPLGDLLRETADAKVCAAMRDEFLTAVSLRSEVVAWSSQVLWPDHLTANELIKRLPPPDQWERNSSLRYVCSGHIPNCAKIDQLPSLLRWVREQGDNFKEYNYFGTRTKESIALSAFNHLDQPSVRTEFISLLAAQTHSSSRLLPLRDRNPESEATMRRLLCQTIIEEHDDLFADKFRWHVWDDALSHLSDLPWAVEQLRVASTLELRERWLTYVFMVFDGTLSAVETIAPIIDLVPAAVDILAQRTSCPLKEFGSHNWQKENYYQKLEEEKQRATRPPFPGVISKALVAFEGGNLNAMPWLLGHLDHHQPEPPPGRPAPRVESLNGWSLIDAELTRRIHNAYPSYLEQITTNGLLFDSESQETGHTFLGLDCLLKTTTQNPTWFESRPTEFWRAWQRPALFLGHYGLREPKHLHTELMVRLYRSAPVDFATALDEALVRHHKQFFALQLVQLSPIRTDAAVRQVLLRHAQDSETTTSLAHDIWGMLLSESMPEAVSYLTTAVNNTPPNAFAAAVLLVHRTATHGSAIAESMIAAPEWLSTVCLSLPGSGFDVRCDWGLRLPANLTLRVWETMEPITPVDPYADGGGSMTPDKSLYHLRTNLLNLLGANPTPESLHALRCMQTRRPNDVGWIGQMLVRMRQSLLRAEWIALSPREVRDYLDARFSPRPISSEGDLCDRVLVIIAEFQRLIRDVPNPSNELWNTPSGPITHWYPRDENEVSNRLQYHLNAALAPIGGQAVRESETRRGHAAADDPTDLPDLVVSVPSATRLSTILQVVIEVKCSWHNEAIEALRTQLSDRYMRTFRCGIYCLVHFTCATWDLPDDGRKNRGKAQLPLNQLRSQLHSLRDALRVERPEHRIEIALIDASRPVPVTR